MAANDNDATSALPAILKAALIERPNGIEAAVIRQWSDRDPLDAAMDSYSLLRRLRYGDDVVEPSAPQRPLVEELAHKWRLEHEPADYLRAADRLLDVMSRWADEEISPPQTSTH